MVSPEAGNPTPRVGATPTDIPSAGRVKPMRTYQLATNDELSDVDLDFLTALPEFKDPLCGKARFIVPAAILFIVYYFALPALSDYARPFMDTHLGPVSISYLFALSQFFMAWIVAALFVRSAKIFGSEAKPIPDGQRNR